MNRLVELAQELLGIGELKRRLKWLEARLLQLEQKPLEEFPQAIVLPYMPDVCVSGFELTKMPPQPGAVREDMKWRCGTCLKWVPANTFHSC